MKWEYKVVTLWQGNLDDSADNTELLNEDGLDSWELVSVDNGIAYFKRPIQLEEQKQTLIQWPPKHTDK